MADLNTAAILDAVESHAAASGYFDKTRGGEPLGSPGAGLTFAVWVDSILPHPAGSGMRSTTGRIEFAVRLYHPVDSRSPDRIDPAMIAATDALIRAYSGDYTLGGLVKAIDLLGMSGTSLRAQSGYVDYAGAEYRVMTITLPILVDDLWSQDG